MQVIRATRALRLFLFLTAIILPATVWGKNASAHCEATSTADIGTEHVPHSAPSEPPVSADQKDHECSHCPPAECIRLTACAYSMEAAAVVPPAPLDDTLP